MQSMLDSTPADCRDRAWQVRRCRTAARCCVALVLMLAAQTSASPQSAAEIRAAIEVPRTNVKPPPTAEAKLDPPLQAVARAWRRYGIRGAERECASRNVSLDRLRIAAVIHLETVDRRSEVERALRRSWGEVRARNEDRVYVRLPVPAIRRLAGHSGVRAIYLDDPVSVTGGSGKERLP